MEWHIILGAIIAAAGLAISYAVFGSHKTKDDKSDGQQIGVVLSDLGYIKGTLDGVTLKLDKQDERNIEILQRLTDVEASTKQAHKRIDRLDAALADKEA